MGFKKYKQGSIVHVHVPDVDEGVRRSRTAHPPTPWRPTSQSPAEHLKFLGRHQCRGGVEAPQSPVNAPPHEQRWRSDSPRVPHLQNFTILCGCNVSEWKKLPLFSRRVILTPSSRPPTHPSIHHSLCLTPVKLLSAHHATCCRLAVRSHNATLEGTSLWCKRAW